MTITTIGLDLAKNVFQAHGVDERGNVVLRKQLRRDRVAPFFAQTRPCIIGIEACGGAHFWAAKLAAVGHQVKMVAPQSLRAPSLLAPAIRATSRTLGSSRHGNALAGSSTTLRARSSKSTPGSTSPGLTCLAINGARPARP
jgi:hypothetical protein